MGLNNPKIKTSKPFSENFREGQAFTLVGGSVVMANSDEYGKGEMSVLDIRLSDGSVQGFGIWGQYIVEQVKAIEPSDVPAEYVVTRDVVEGYSKRPVKMLAPASPQERREAASDDIPF